jgi:hypothetical protein
VGHSSGKIDGFEKCFIYEINSWPFFKQYENLSDNVKNLLTYYWDNFEYLGFALYYPGTTNYNSGLCIHQKLYYTRPPLYEKSKGSYPEGCRYDGKTFINVL